MNIAYAWPVLEFAGIFVAAVSGAQAAVRKRLDLVGAFALALATATGGGTLRSLFLGDTPVPLLRTPWPLALCIAATLAVSVLYKQIERLRYPIRLFDALALASFLAVGMAIALDRGAAPWAAALLGVITAVAGGVIRDVLLAQVPLIFKPGELYATPTLIGAGAIVIALHLGAGRNEALTLGASLTLGLRIAAIYRGWSTRPLSR